MLPGAYVLDFYGEEETMVPIRNQNGVELKHYIEIFSA